MIYITVIVTMS